eukprot:776957-Alexandrium_andersonii.AAC.1
MLRHNLQHFRRSVPDGYSNARWFHRRSVRPAEVHGHDKEGLPLSPSSVPLQEHPAGLPHLVRLSERPGPPDPQRRRSDPFHRGYFSCGHG